MNLLVFCYPGNLTKSGPPEKEGAIVLKTSPAKIRRQASGQFVRENGNLPCGKFTVNWPGSKVTLFPLALRSMN